MRQPCLLLLPALFIHDFGASEAVSTIYSTHSRWRCLMSISTSFFIHTRINKMPLAQGQSHCSSAILPAVGGNTALCIPTVRLFFLQVLITESPLRRDAGLLPGDDSHPVAAHPDGVHLTQLQPNSSLYHSPYDRSTSYSASHLTTVFCLFPPRLLSRSSFRKHTFQETLLCTVATSVVSRKAAL